jgi:hypothetical protein
MMVRDGRQRLCAAGGEDTMSNHLTEYFQRQAAEHANKAAMPPHDQRHAQAGKTLSSLADLVQENELRADDTRYAGKPVPEVQGIVVALEEHLVELSPRGVLSLDGKRAKEAVSHYGYGSDIRHTKQHTEFLKELLALCQQDQEARQAGDGSE